MISKNQLLDMSEDDYMNDIQLEFFKELLSSQKKELTENISTARQSLSNNEHNIDESDIASSQEMQHYNLRTAERQARLLNKIIINLKKIDNGEYGYCEETGDPIGIKRLLARPTATLSIQAKEAQEHQERTQGIIRDTDH